MSKLDEVLDRYYWSLDYTPDENRQRIQELKHAILTAVEAVINERPTTMPNRTIYIRTEDIEAWEKIYSPEWLHSVIQSEAKPRTAEQEEYLRRLEAGENK